MKTLLATVLLFAAAFTPLAAQVPPPPAANVRFFAIENIPGELFLKSGATTVPVPPALFTASAPVSLVPGRTYALARKTLEREGDKLVEKITPLASLAVPAKATALLIILVPSADYPAALPDTVITPLVIDDSLEAFPAGSMRVINLTPAALALKTGDTASIINPWDRTLTRPVPDAKNRIWVQGAYRDSADQWVVCQNGGLLLPPSSRLSSVVVFSRTGMSQWFTEEQRRSLDPNPKAAVYWLTSLDTSPPAAP